MKLVVLSSAEMILRFRGVRHVCHCTGLRQTSVGRQAVMQHEQELLGSAAHGCTGDGTHLGGARDSAGRQGCTEGIPGIEVRLEAASDCAADMHDV